jgi:hypothetical protein
MQPLLTQLQLFHCEKQADNKIYKRQAKKSFFNSVNRLIYNIAILPSQEKRLILATLIVQRTFYRLFLVSFKKGDFHLQNVGELVPAGLLRAAPSIFPQQCQQALHNVFLFDW